MGRTKMLKHVNTALLMTGVFVFPALSAKSGKVLHVPSEYPTLMAALVHADDGDSVIAAPGRYAENVTLVQGVVVTCSDPLKCTIDGMRRGPAVYAVAGSEISNFTITNGIDGILCENAAALHIHHNWIVDNEGAGISAFIALPQIDNNVIYGNRWSGVLVWGAKSLDSRIENNVILRNGYSGVSLRGPTRVVVRNNVFMENNEYGIYSDPDAGQSQIVYNDIYENNISFNRYTKANGSNIPLDPMFIDAGPSTPNFFPGRHSPLIRRGSDQVDIGLLAQDETPVSSDTSGTSSSSTHQLK
jgi:OOP family OmpA-OmpF porin